MGQADAVRFRQAKPQPATSKHHRRQTPHRRNSSSLGVPRTTKPRYQNQRKRQRPGPATAKVLLPISWRRLHTPHQGLPGNQDHQRQDGQKSASWQPTSCRTYLSPLALPPTTIPQRADPSPTQSLVPSSSRDPSPPSSTASSNSSTSKPSAASTQARGLRRAALLRGHPHDY
jgi:hypothetical protein